MHRVLFAAVALWTACQGGTVTKEACQLDPGVVDLIIRGAGTRAELRYVELACDETAPRLMGLVRHIRPWHADGSGQKHGAFAADAHSLIEQRCGPEPLTHERCNTLRYLRDDPISEAVVAGTMLYEMIVAEVGEVRARWLALRIARATFNDGAVTFGLLGVDHAEVLPVWHGGHWLPPSSFRVVNGTLAGSFLPPPPTLEQYFDPSFLEIGVPFTRALVFEDLKHDTPLTAYIERRSQFGERHRVSVLAVAPDAPTDAPVKVPAPHDGLALVSLDSCLGPCETPTLFATLTKTRWVLRRGQTELVSGTPDEVLRALRHARCDMTAEPAWHQQTIGLVGDDATTIGDAVNFIGSVDAEPKQGCWPLMTWVTVVGGEQGG